MIMQKVNIEAFKVIGIAIRTSNNNNQSAQDIGQLWNRFMAEGIAEKIPNKMETSVLSIYTNYEGDHTLPYDTVLACKVNSLDDIPEGMVGMTIGGGTFAKFVSRGALEDGIIINSWKAIWETELDRAYLADYELYDERAQNPADVEVDILVSING